MNDHDIATAQQGDTVDLICRRHYKRTEDVTEAVLLANPGLAAKGPVLPMGTQINLPRLTLHTIRRTVQLWD